MSTVVVTGASGFIGSALLPRLKSAGLAVMGVTRGEGTGHRRVGDYADAPLGDVLIHLGQDSERSRVNADGLVGEKAAQRTITRLSKKGFRKIVYASSAVLYGDRQDTAHPETDPIAVVDSYTRIKALSEEEVLAAGGVVARLSNLYGPGMAKGNVFSRILEQVPGRDEVTVLTARPVRDFVWVNDAADAILRLVLSPHAGIFNIGTGVGTSVHDLARLVLTVAGESERSVRSSESSSEPSCLVLDIGRIRQVTGWRPLTMLSDGVDQLLRTKRTAK